MLLLRQTLTMASVLAAPVPTFKRDATWGVWVVVQLQKSGTSVSSEPQTDLNCLQLGDIVHAINGTRIGTLGDSDSWERPSNLLGKPPPQPLLSRLVSRLRRKRNRTEKGGPVGGTYTLHVIRRAFIMASAKPNSTTWNATQAVLEAEATTSGRNARWHLKQALLSTEFFRVKHAPETEGDVENAQNSQHGTSSHSSLSGDGTESAPVIENDVENAQSSQHGTSIHGSLSSDGAEPDSLRNLEQLQ